MPASDSQCICNGLSRGIILSWRDRQRSRRIMPMELKMSRIETRMLVSRPFFQAILQLSYLPTIMCWSLILSTTMELMTSSQSSQTYSKTCPLLLDQLGLPYSPQHYPCISVSLFTSTSTSSHIVCHILLFAIPSHSLGCIKSRDLPTISADMPRSFP